MSIGKNDFTLSVAILLLVIISWMSRGNLAGHLTEQDDSLTVVDELDNLPNVAVRIDTSIQGLTIYYPITDSIVLRCFDRPIPDKDSAVVFCCAAAFTRYDRPHENNHLNVAGDHVCSGERHSGYPCNNNTGAVVFYNGTWKFLYESYSYELDSAAFYGGSGFAQELLVHEGIQINTVRSLTQVGQYRALCQRKQELCIIDAKGTISFGSFINSLLGAGVGEALYMDMGDWHYSWYKQISNGKATYIFPDYKESATNWLLFYFKR